jgi:8-oxo-dGTP pyrophosphatase MutT (NUDIX family)
MNKHIYTIASGAAGSLVAVVVLLALRLFVGEAVPLSEQLLAVVAAFVVVAYVGRAPFRRYALRVMEKQIGVTEVFSNFADCEAEILARLEATGSARMFLQIGTSVLSGNRTIYEHLEGRLDWSGINSFRLLYVDENSDYVNDSRAAERGSNIDRWKADLRRAREQLQLLKRRVGAKLDYRQHSEPFLWRLFIFDEVAYIQPYLYDRQNSERAPVLKTIRRHRREGDQLPSLFKLVDRYFDTIWNRCQPSATALEEIAERSEGIAVIGRLRKGRTTVFVVPKRELLNPASDSVDLQLPGGKVEAKEAYSDALRREYSEEVSLRVQPIDSATCTVVKDNSTPVALRLLASGESRPRIVIRRSNATKAKWVLVYELRLLGKFQPKPRAEAGAVLLLTPELVRKSQMGTLTWKDVADAKDGSRAIASASVVVRPEIRLTLNQTLAYFASDAASWTDTVAPL